MRDRLINRRQQGDLGEASAIEWLTRQGALVWSPLGHSPDVDMLASSGGDALRIQVKTSTCQVRTPDRHMRWSVAVCTNGGNQSWTGVTKHLDPDRVDYVFVLVGDGRRWFIPGSALEARNSVALGGPKYSEFEIEPGSEITSLVYGKTVIDSTIERRSGEYPSGQRTAPVKRQAQPSQVRILPPPSGEPPGARHERKLGRAGQAIVRGKRLMTIPARPYAEAGLEVGDRVRFRADGPGRVVMERIEVPATIFDVAAPD